MILAFPKPGQVKRKRKYLDDDGVFRFPDGREVCDLNSAKGRAEYMRRKRLMWERQAGICCLAGEAPMCPVKLNWGDAMFEHEGGRGGGKRDDRIEVIEERNGLTIKRIQNGVAHAKCNSWKGSRRISYNEIVP